jgi:hypothetical protein
VDSVLIIAVVGGLAVPLLAALGIAMLVARGRGLGRRQTAGGILVLIGCLVVGLAAFALLLSGLRLLPGAPSRFALLAVAAAGALLVRVGWWVIGSPNLE